MHDILLFIKGMAIWGGAGVAAVLIVLAMVELWEPQPADFSFIWIALSPFLVVLSLFTDKYSKSGILHRKRAVAARIEAKPESSRTFHTVREAKDYLAGRIVAEAEEVSTPLTELERKMLYFSETGWTLPDMKVVNEEFERQYNSSDYEKKIAALVGAIERKDAANNLPEQAAWDRALEKLSGGDHYLSAMIGEVQPEKKLLPLWLRISVTLLLMVLFGILRSWSKHWLNSR